MWYPPSVLVPMYLEPNALTRPVPAMWSAVPQRVKQHLCFAVNDLEGYLEHRLSEDERKFLLSKSVYDLVKANCFLELTDPKLLGWYLSLPAEDRKLMQAEGGLIQFLHRHPALEVFRHIVYLKQYDKGNCCSFPALEMSSKLDGSKQTPIYGQSQCVNCGTSSPCDAEKCRCCSTLFLNQDENVCVHEEENKLWLLPRNVRAELNLVKDKGQVSEDMATRGSQQSDCMQSALTNMSAFARNLSNGFQQPAQPSYNLDDQPLCQMWDGKKVQMFKDPLTQASSLLDGELELPSHHHSNDHDQLPLPPDTNPDFSNLEKEKLPEYYSLSEEHKSAQWDNATNNSIMATKHSTEASTDKGPRTCGAENCTFPDSVSLLSNSSGWTDLTEDGQNLSSEDETRADEHHTMNEEESSSSATCVPVSDQGTCKSEFACKVGSLSTNMKCEVSTVSLVDAGSDFRACFTSSQTTEITQDFVVKRFEDVFTSTDFSPVNQETQTIPKQTSEKSTITEVYMSDLDAICEEFEKFKMMEEELLHLKDERTYAEKPRNEQQQCQRGCGALSRARSAELRLLALQFAMCQQHCWRCFYTSTPVETSVQRIKDVPDAVSQTLRSLEDQYVKMRRKILEGVPLDNLEPLSVDTKRLKEETCYRPSLIYEAFLDDCLSESSYETFGGLRDKGQINKEDELHESTLSTAINSRQRQESVSNEDKPVAANRENECFLLSVSNLPNTVNEELLCWFAKYNTNQVSFTSLSNARVAIVSVMNPNDAEAAIMEMNGRSIEGNTLHVEHLHKPPVVGQITVKESCVRLAPAANKAGSAGEELIPQTVNIFDASGALHRSLDKMTNISTTPTATGTCVPQHYGTMGSFDTIMAQLLERHSNLGRQQIIGALLQLQTKNHGVLSGLPFTDIVNMTSELLTHSATDQA